MSMPDVGLRLLFCTAPSDAAPRLARTLLEAKLIGCANLIPSVRSLYWWEDEIQDDHEIVMLMECRSERVDQAMAVLNREHPYDVPKIVVIEPSSVSEPYLAWLRAATS